MNPPRNSIDVSFVTAAEGAALAAAPKRAIVQMPDEYLPPNKILFLQNLPETATKTALTDLFTQYVISSPFFGMVYSRKNAIRRYPNLVEVRMIPTKKDIAFVEYADEASSGVAKDALHNYKLDGEQKIKVRVITPFSLVSCSTH